MVLEFTQKIMQSKLAAIQKSNLKSQRKTFIASSLQQEMALIGQENLRPMTQNITNGLSGYLFNFLKQDLRIARKLLLIFAYRARRCWRMNRLYKNSKLKTQSSKLHLKTQKLRNILLCVSGARHLLRRRSWNSGFLGSRNTRTDCSRTSQN